MPKICPSNAESKKKQELYQKREEIADDREGAQESYTENRFNHTLTVQEKETVFAHRNLHHSDLSTEISLNM